jgi:hypothetical protein
MIISDPIALFTTPFALTMASNAVDILNESSLLLVPFAVLICVETFKAIMGSSDSGSAAMKALVNIDLRFFGMVIMMSVAVMPMSGTPKFTYSQYSCTSTPSILENIDSTDDLKPSSGFTYGTEQPSIALGLINDTAVAINGVLLAKLPCTAGASRSDVMQIQDDTFPSGPQLYRSIKDFHGQCYLRARSNIESHLAKGETLAYAASSSDTANAFNSTLMSYAYSGYITSASEASDGNLTFEVNDTWIDDTETESTLDCSTAAATLYTAISDDLVTQEDYSDENATLLDYYNLYGNYSESDVKQDLINLTYFNVSSMPTENSELGFQEAIESMNDDSFTTSNPILQAISAPWNALNAGVDGSVEYINTMSADGAWEAAKELTTDVFLTIGSGYTAVSENLKAQMAVIALPMISSICMGLLICLAPIFSVASGYSYTKFWHYFVLYLSLAMIPFWVNFGLTIDTIVHSYMSANVDTTDTTTRWISEGTGAVLVYTAAVVWIVLMQLAAGGSSNAVGGMLAGGIAGATAGLQAAQKEGQKQASKSVNNGGSSTKGSGGGSNGAGNVASGASSAIE